jgi:hypothetical protein
MNSFRRHDAHQQTKIICPTGSIIETQPPAPTAFAEIVGDDLPVLHADDCASFALHTAMTKLVQTVVNG